MTNRNANAVRICEESSVNNICPGDACPIRPACAWRPDDDREVWTVRTNAAADKYVAKGSVMEYGYFRQMILSKANGRTIHKINSLLGQFMEQKKTSDYWATIAGHEDEHCRTGEHAKRALNELCDITGLTFNYEEIIV